MWEVQTTSSTGMYPALLLHQTVVVVLLEGKREEMGVVSSHSQGEEIIPEHPNTSVMSGVALGITPNMEKHFFKSTF